MPTRSEWWAHLTPAVKAAMMNVLRKENSPDIGECEAVVESLIEGMTLFAEKIDPKIWEFVMTGFATCLKEQRRISPCPKNDPLTQ